MEFAIDGIGIAALIIGIVEAAKEFGVSGKWSRALALFLGVFFVGLSGAMQQGVIPAEAHIYISLIVTSLAGGLAAELRPARRRRLSSFLPRDGVYCRVHHGPSQHRRRPGLS